MYQEQNKAVRPAAHPLVDNLCGAGKTITKALWTHQHLLIKICFFFVETATLTEMQTSFMVEVAVPMPSLKFSFCIFSHYNAYVVGLRLFINN